MPSRFFPKERLGIYKTCSYDSHVPLHAPILPLFFYEECCVRAREEKFRNKFQLFSGESQATITCRLHSIVKIREIY